MMPSRFSALLASSRPSPTNSTSSSSPSPAAPAYAPHHPYHPSLSLSHLQLNEQQLSRNYGEAAMPSAGEEGGGRGGQGQGSPAGGGRAGFFLPPSAAGYDEDDGREARRRFSLAMSEDAEVPQLDEVRGGGGEGGWFSPVQRIQQQQHNEQYTYATPRSYGAHSRQPTYQTLDALLAASSSASSSSAYPSYPQQQQQQQGQPHDSGIGGDFSFASSFGLAEEGSPTVAPEDVSPLSPSRASLFEQQEYFSPALSSADVGGGGGGSFFGSAPAYQPVQHQHKQQPAYHPPTYSTSSASSAAPIPLSRPTAAPIGAFLPPTSRESLSESPYQPFAFSPSSFTHSAPSSAPAAYPAQSHSLTGAFLPPPAKGSGAAPSTSTFSSSAASNFSTLSAPSVPLAGSSLLAFATPAPGTAFPHSHSGPGILASYRRASYAPSSYSPSLTNASPPSPPRSSGSLLAAAFGPSPLIGTSAAGDLARYNNTPPSPVESFLSSGSPPVVRGFAPSSAPAASSSSRSYPPITSPSSSSSTTAPSKRKKRSSSTAAASSSFLDDAYDPDYNDDDEAAKLRNRPISPITGKPTKIIAKRGWPPKDAAKRVYRCEVEGCGKSFGRPSAKETHMRSHTGAKPFTCPVPSCSRAFGVYSNLKRHMIVHPSVDFRSVSVHDLPLIHWIDDPDDPNGAGGRLEWIDEMPQGDSSAAVGAQEGGGEEVEEMEE